MSKVLRLYITGCSVSSQHAAVNLRRLCEVQLRGEYQCEIIDVLDCPEQAEQDKIIATPTLIKRYPAPSRKIIGDLSQIDKVLFGLGLTKLDLPENQIGPSDLVLSKKDDAK